MIDQVEIPGDVVTLRENGYDSEGNLTTRIEVRALISYSRTLVDNNNQMETQMTPGFRLPDLSPDILSVFKMYHEHRQANPCKLEIFIYLS